jgi:hypothetical protein
VFELKAVGIGRNWGQSAITGTRTETKLNALRPHFYKSHLGVPNLLVLTVTTDNQRQEEIMRRLKEQDDRVDAFLFKALGDGERTSLSSQLLIEPWIRVGFLPLRIDGKS